MATPRPALGHAVDQLHRDLPVAVRRPGPSDVIARGLVLGATATLAVTLLPGTAAADPGDATSAAQAAQLVARAAHDLEVVTEQVDEARETSARPQAAVRSADRAAAETRRVSTRSTATSARAPARPFPPQGTAWPSWTC